ncbi:MAG: cyclic nucleotide-binding domain-containing protein [candidate division NC10 bacterium]|nr:cyclic nucleotide-binding domain-containing protein [candidate division NC10 bacterium]
MEMNQLFRRIFLFQDLSDEELALISAITAERDYSQGDVIFREGDWGDAFYIILEGRVRISKEIAGAGEEALAILDKGNYFGEMALIDEFPRSATAIAHTDCRLLLMDRSDFLQLLPTHKDLANKLLWVFCKTLSHRLRETNEKITSLFALARGF